MKKLILSVVAIATTLIGCQKKERTTFEINGTIENPGKATSIVLMNMENRTDTIAVATIENGTYTLTGSVAQPVKAGVRLERGGFQFVLENDVFTINTKENGTTIEGGSISSVVYGYKKDPAYQEADKNVQEVSSKVFTGLDMMDKEAVNKARLAYDKVRKVALKIKNDYEHKVLQGDAPTLVKLYTLAENYDWDRYTIADRIALYDSYDKALGGNEFAKKAKEDYVILKKSEEERKSIAPGKPFKEVVATTLAGDEIKLSDVIAKNKYTLLEFWASWCGPCRAEFPHLKKAYGKYNPKGFEIYGLSVDTDKDKWIKAMNEEDVPWINVVDYKGFESKATQDYVVSGIPASFLIDQEGKIVASMNDVRGFALDEKLKELLEE